MDFGLLYAEHPYHAETNTMKPSTHWTILLGGGFVIGAAMGYILDGPLSLVAAVLGGIAWGLTCEGITAGIAGK